MPLIPFVSMTLLALIKNSIPSFIANSPSMKIKTLQLARIPEITYDSYGIPGAKWMWFLFIVFKPSIFIKSHFAL